MKFLPLLLLTLALVACGKDDDKKTSTDAVSTNDQVDLRGPVVTPVAGATFARFYGNFKVTNCETLADKATDVDYCSYSELAVYAMADYPGVTLISLRKHIDHGISMAEEAFDKALTDRSYHEDGDLLASVYSSYPAPNTTFVHETTMRKLSDGTYTLTLRDIFKTLEGKDNHDREFRFTLVRD